MAFTLVEYTVNVDTKKLVKANYPTVPVTSRPVFTDKETCILGLHFVRSNGNDYALGVTDTFDLGVDPDFTYTLDTGVTLAEYSGTVASVACSGLTIDIPETGYLVLINPSGDVDRIGYTDYADGAFTVSATLGATYPVGSTLQVEDELMVYSSNALVDVAGDWASINRSTGRISVRLNCNTESFERKIAAAAASGDMPAYLQLRRTPGGETDYSVLLQDICMTRKGVIGATGGAGQTSPQYLTQTAADGRYLRIDFPVTTLTATAIGNTISELQVGYNAAPGDVVYLGPAGKWLKAAAGSYTTCEGLLGIVLESKSANQTAAVALPGSVVQLGTWAWSPQNVLYVGAVAGGLQTAHPTGADSVIRVAGFAITATKVYFNPSSDYQTVVA
jgi:hypothetical protein